MITLAAAAPEYPTVTLDVGAVIALQSHRQLDDSAVEHCGILLGGALVDANGDSNIVITSITEPSPGELAKATRTYCEFDGAHHTAEIARIYEAHAGRVNALGHWHTHPQDHPTPSGLDWRDWYRRLRDDDYGSHAVFAIVGRCDTRLWIGARGGVEILPLEALS